MSNMSECRGKLANGRSTDWKSASIICTGFQSQAAGNDEQSSNSTSLNPISPSLIAASTTSSVVSINVTSSTGRSKRTNRMSRYWRARKNLIRECIASVIGNHIVNDPRPYATINILGTEVRGLLDSGATVSLLGHGSVELLNSAGIKPHRLESSVRTADGTPNRMIGFVDLDVTYLNLVKRVRFCIVPSLEGELYLGIDFWWAFNIAPQLFNKISAISVPLEKLHALSDSQQKILEDTKQLFPSFKNLGLGKTTLIQHEIDVGNAKAIKQRHYAVSPAVQDLLYNEIDRMLDLKVIEESASPWCSPVVIVRKPNGKARLCLDLRKVNDVSIKDGYPLPLIDGLIARLSETRFITSLDLKDAFWQVPLAESSRPMTAFAVPGRPQYQFRVMPFGCCNATQTMCKLMDRVIPYQLHDRVFVYLDDLLIVSSSFEQHIELLRIVADRLKAANLTINLEKSHFSLTECKFLGFLVGEGGLRADPAKIDAVKNFPAPSTVRQVRRLLGMAGWYRRFIPNFATVTAPITGLLKKNVKFLWTQEAQSAFETLKTLLTTAPILINPDYQKRFFIRCDASTQGIGSVLYQLDEGGNERPISYISQKLNGAQKNYCVTELECLAALISVKKFRPYVEGHQFTIITDHASLKWLMNQKDLSGRLARWSLKLQAFDFTIEHEKGSQNVVADALSRIQCDTVAEFTSCLPLLVNSITLDGVEFEEEEYSKLREKIASHGEDYPAFRIHQSRIYIRLEPKVHENLIDMSTYKLWVPKGMRDQLLRQEHDDPSAAHGGIKKTLERLRRLYYWPGMVSQIRNYVSKCETCKQTKHPNRTLRPPMTDSVVISERPFQKIYIDFLGPYPRSRSGKLYIFLVIDQLTKFVLMKTCAKAQASTVVEYLRNEVFNVYGVPELIFSDNGTQFVGKQFEALVKEFGVRHMRTAVYSPQANAAERVNRSILSAIRAYIKTKHTDWDKHLGDIANALRNSHHEAINVSPHLALFGYQQVNNGNTYKLLREIECLSEGEIEMLPLTSRLALVHSDIRKRIKEAHEKSARRYNLRTRPISFSPGDEVFARQHPVSDATKKYSAKFALVFKKATVKKRIGNVMYALVDEDGKDLGVFHAKDLKT